MFRRRLLSKAKKYTELSFWAHWASSSCRRHTDDDRSIERRRKKSSSSKAENFYRISHYTFKVYWSLFNISNGFSFFSISTPSYSMGYIYTPLEHVVFVMCSIPIQYIIFTYWMDWEIEPDSRDYVVCDSCAVLVCRHRSIAKENDVFQEKQIKIWYFSKVNIHNSTCREKSELETDSMLRWRVACPPHISSRPWRSHTLACCLSKGFLVLFTWFHSDLFRLAIHFLVLEIVTRSSTSSIFPSTRELCELMCAVWCREGVECLDRFDFHKMSPVELCCCFLEISNAIYFVSFFVLLLDMCTRNHYGIKALDMS